ncbi:MAG: biotin--[acetyl-CoA-carboxylase] ligase [Defluviitaleaceae bacterium]|nr:biotin--[acetyl-CoA-carboxylase] ligase [Defluviitaleaceae bacterium]
MDMHSLSTDKILVFDSLESTNITAKEMAASGACHGTVVIAERQSAGKGRMGRAFFSPPGCGIYMSVVLCPDLLGFGTPSLVTALAAVCVCESIEQMCGKEPRIKWVNDIFLDGKKICGILTEAVTNPGGRIERVVLGVGVNFSTPETDFPPNLQQTAGSIFPNGNPPVTRPQFAADIINRIIKPPEPPSTATMLGKYKKRMMMLGSRITVSGTGEAFEATAVDIDDAGRLIVKTDRGDIIKLTSGDISIREGLNIL